MAGTYIGTRHNSPHGGSGRKQSSGRRMTPVLRAPKGITDRAFLKTFGSRPAHKQSRRLDEVA